MTMRNDRRLKIGAVSYLNSKPLVEGLAEFLPQAELLLDYPSRLADDLAAGQIDVGLVPIVECFGEPLEGPGLRDEDPGSRVQGPGENAKTQNSHDPRPSSLNPSRYRIVSDACVATRGPVLSVKLYSRVPIARIRRLALDEGSRTSAILVRVLLAERFDIVPEQEPLPLGCSVNDTDADAILLIGDRAIHQPRERFAETWDLGEEWTRQTDLPFVFAVWAARPETDVTTLEPAFRQARDLGVQRLRDIARREAAAVGIDEQAAYDYLSRNLCFRMESAEQRGLELFRQLAAKHGLILEKSPAS